MNRRVALILIAVAFAVSPLQGQMAKRDPRVGYLFPAGAQQGTTVHVLVGGQFLQGAAQVHVSGRGVAGRVLEHYRPLRNLSAEQRGEIARRLATLARQRWEELVTQGRVQGKMPWGWASRRHAQVIEGAEPVTLPVHHLLNGWESMSLRQLAHTREKLTDRSKLQPNTQIDETVLIEVAVDAVAAVGDYELRLLGKGGLTNPLIFQVGALPEVYEVERNDPVDWDPLPAEPPVNLPVVINGQVMPGDVDRLRFNAKAGQRLVVQVRARRLMPFMADAVPGWFQPLVTVYDAKGKELAFADDYRFDPDPVLVLDVPADGVYAVEIRDAVYRGREDFVYRASIGALPFITSLYPLGRSMGQAMRAELGGWNLPADRITLPNVKPGVHLFQPDHSFRFANAVAYQSDAAPSCAEREPNDQPDRAQRFAIPMIVDGRIGAAGDVDVYRIDGRAGQRVVAQVTARRLGSPLDSLLRLYDDKGKVIAWNDDAVEKRGHLHPDMGVQTHQADSYLSIELPAGGTYYLGVSDLTGHGGPEYGYRLYVGSARPDFELLVAPSSVNVATGQSAAISVHVLRRDGFEGPIELSLKNAPEGFTLDGATIGAGRKDVRVTLTAPTQRPSEPVALVIEGRATIAGKVVTHDAAPVDDVMQAFLWRHLAPAQQMLAAVVGPARAGAAPLRVGDGPVRVPIGGTATVQFRGRFPSGVSDVQLHAQEPPPGVSLSNGKIEGEQLTFTVTAGNDATLGGADNLIIELSADASWKDKEGKAHMRRRQLGMLRAVPITIVEHKP
ncbi:MAG: PPC domain-containing protein [Phycisphaeraceae bacterium]